MLAAEGAQPGFVQSFVSAYDEELDRLAGTLIRHADTGAFQHAVGARDDGLDLAGIDVEAGDNDDVLAPFDEGDEAALVDGGDRIGADRGGV